MNPVTYFRAWREACDDAGAMLRRRRKAVALLDAKSTDAITPADYQAAFVDDPSRVVVARGGNSSGKTEAGAIKVARILKHAPPYPNCPFWIIGQSFELACGVCWAEKLTKHFAAHEIRKISWHDQARNWPAAVRLHNGWVIEFKSSEQGRRLFQARSIGGAWIDEQFPASIFIEIFARTRDTRGQIIMTQTPIEFDQFMEDKFNSHSPGWSWHQFRTRDNSFVSSDWIDAFEQEIPEQFRATRMAGEFGSFQGAVYPLFNRNVHVIPAVNPATLADKLIVRSIDFGFNNPFVCLWLYKTGDGGWVVFQEYYKPRTRIAEHAATIKTMSDGMNVQRTWADPEDAAARNELGALGVPTSTARKAVRAGIEETQRLMMVMGDGKPRLHVTANCPNTIRELSSYRWDKGTVRTDPDMPLKKDDHTCDALRYALYSEKPYSDAGTGAPEMATNASRMNRIMNSTGFWSDQDDG